MTRMELADFIAPLLVDISGNPDFHFPQPERIDL
jgi:hypothetical protein